MNYKIKVDRLIICCLYILRDPKLCGGSNSKNGVFLWIPSPFLLNHYILSIMFKRILIGLTLDSKRTKGPYKPSAGDRTRGP